MYRDTLLQKLQHLAEGILTKRRLIDRNTQHNIANNGDLRVTKADMATTLSPNSKAIAVI